MSVAVPAVALGAITGTTIGSNGVNYDVAPAVSPDPAATPTSAAAMHALLGGNGYTMRWADTGEAEVLEGTMWKLLCGSDFNGDGNADDSVELQKVRSPAGYVSPPKM